MINPKYIFLILSFLDASATCAQSNSVQNKYTEKVVQHYTESVAEYSTLPNTFDGRFLGSDEALELSPEYLENPALAEVLRTAAQFPAAAMLFMLMAAAHCQLLTWSVAMLI